MRKIWIRILVQCQQEKGGNLVKKKKQRRCRWWWFQWIYPRRFGGVRVWWRVGRLIGWMTLHSKSKLFLDRSFQFCSCRQPFDPLVIVPIYVWPMLYVDDLNPVGVSYWTPSWWSRMDGSACKRHRLNDQIKSNQIKKKKNLDRIEIIWSLVGFRSYGSQRTRSISWAPPNTTVSASILRSIRQTEVYPT